MLVSLEELPIKLKKKKIILNTVVIYIYIQYPFFISLKNCPYNYFFFLILNTVVIYIYNIHSYDILYQNIAITLYQCLYFDYRTLCMILLGAKASLPGACTVSAVAHAPVATTKTGPIHT